MPLKPVDKRNPFESRDAVWKIIRVLKVFTTRDLWMETRLGIETVREYLKGLLNAGYIAIQGEVPHSGKEGTKYVLVRDTGVEAPRVRKDGSEIIAGRGRERMWTSMRILKEFSVYEIIATASTEAGSIAIGEANNFIARLHKAGYLVITSKGGAGKLTRYRLLSVWNTGPKPPIVQRSKSVFDQNLRKVVWSKEGANDRA